MQKISVRIDWTKDDAGKYEIQIVMGSNDFFSSGLTIRTKVKQFKQQYLQLIKNAQKIIPQKQARLKNKTSKKRSKKPTKTSASVYWKLGDLFRKFNGIFSGGTPNLGDVVSLITPEKKSSSCSQYLTSKGYGPIRINKPNLIYFNIDSAWQKLKTEIDL